MNFPSSSSTDMIDGRLSSRKNSMMTSTSTLKPHEYSFELFLDPNTGTTKYRLPKKWEASSHYSKTLRQVRRQVTPAGQYREYYKAYGRLEGVLTNLDRRIQATNENVEQCTHAITRLQARFRGWIGRMSFWAMRDMLIDARTQREIRKLALLHYYRDEKRESLNVILQYRGPSLGLGLYVMKCKLYYSLGELDACMITARELLALDRTNIDGNYILACCLVKREKYEAAYQLFSTLFSESTASTKVEHVVRLNGFICTKLNPPKFAEGVENFDFLIKEHPEDMKSSLQRACCYMSLQEWDKAIADYSYILEYQPQLTHVICMRARAYTCKRQWDKARQDYAYVLRFLPGDPEATQGLAEMSQIVEPYPMNIPER